MTEPTAAATGEPLRIRAVRVGELEAFAEEALSAATNAVVPVSRLRAVSQSRNPHAAPDDVALLVAYQGSRTAGYLGLLPGRLRLGGEERPVHWMSTWYVDPALRGRRAGYRLFQAARELGLDLFGTAFSADAERVMRQAGFLTFGPVEFLTLDLRRVAPLAAPAVALRRRLRKSGREGRLSDVAWKLDRALGRPGRRLALRTLLRSFSSRGRGIWEEEVEGISPAAFGEGGSPDGSRFVRDREVVNWTIGHPWVEEGAGGGSPADRKYYFSRERRIFRRRPLHFVDQATGEEVGFALLSTASVRERIVVRMLDHRLPGEAVRAAAIAAALRFALRHDADSVVLPAALGPELRRSLLARLLLRRESRGYLGLPADPQGDLAGRLGEIRVDYCDGDTALNA